MDFWGRLISGIIVVIMVTIFPLQYLSQSNSVSIDTLLEEQTKTLSDEIRDKGYLDIKMYEDYMRFLSSTGDLYDFTLQDIHPVTSDELVGVDSIKDSFVLNTNNNINEIENSELSTINTSYHVHNEECNHEHNEEIDSLSIKTLSNTKDADNQISLFSTHTHTDACFTGHNHDASCQLGYRCCNGAPLTFSTDGYSYYWNCSICHKSIFRIQWLNFELDGPRYSYINARFSSEALRMYNASTGVGDITAMNTYNYAQSLYYQYKLYSITSYDQFYSTFPIFNMPSNVLCSIHSGTALGTPEYYDANAVYACKPVVCAGNSVSFVNEKIYTVASGNAFPRITLVEYKCNTCGKKIVHTYYQPIGSGYTYEYAKNSYIVEGWDAWNICEQSASYLVSYAATSGLPLYYNPDVIKHFMGVFTSKITEYGYAAVPLEQTPYTYNTYSEIGNRVGEDGFGSVYDTRIRFKSDTSAQVPHYELITTTPICNQVVSSITPTNPTQTVTKGQNIITTATATYLDGHTGVVNCSSNYNANQIGAQTVTLTYSGLVVNAKTNGTLTCTLNVTTLQATKSCTAGLSHPDYKSTLSACPICTAIAGISATNLITTYDGSTKQLSVGNTTGEQIAIFYDTDPSAAVVWSMGVGPSAVGTYPVHIYLYMRDELTGNWNYWFVTGRYITINSSLKTITVSPLAQVIERYQNPSFQVVAAYNDSSTKTLAQSDYTVTGINTNIVGTQTATITYTEGSLTKTATASVTVTLLSKICEACGTKYFLDENDVDHGCPNCKSSVIGIKVTTDNVSVKKGDSLPIIVYAQYRDGSSGDVSGWTSNYDSSSIGLQVILVSYGGYSTEVTVWVNEQTVICPVCGTEYLVSAGTCPVCAETVKSISVNPGSVTVKQYDEINLTVTALYADGTIRAVTDWSIDRTSEEAGNFTATVTYKSITTTIFLNVTSISAVTCPICHLTYEPADSPKGCPVCANTITEIEAYLTSETNKVQYGSTPQISVVLIFLDEHRELTTEDYSIDDYNSTMIGMQTIVISYGLFCASIEIEVVNALNIVTCPNGHEYYLNESGIDSGCPICSITTENIDNVFFFDIIYTTEILDTVYTNGKYIFEKGNYISIEVIKRDISIFTKTQKTFFKTAMLGRKKRLTYGGEVY